MSLKILIADIITYPFRMKTIWWSIIPCTQNEINYPMSDWNYALCLWISQWKGAPAAGGVFIACQWTAQSSSVMTTQTGCICMQIVIMQRY